MKLEKMDKVEIEWVDAVEGDMDENEKATLTKMKHIGYFISKSKEVFAVAFGYSLNSDSLKNYKTVLRIPVENVKKIRKLKGEKK